MGDYEASIICTVFNNKYEFEDNLLIGIAHSPTEAKALLMEDVFRIMEDFGSDKCHIENGRSEYDEPITIVHTHDEDNDNDLHWHYYCLFNEKGEPKSKEENQEINKEQ